MAEVFLWAVPWVAGAIGISGALLAVCEATNIMRSEHDVSRHTVSALLQFDAANLVDLTDDNLKVLNGMVVEPSPNDDGKVRLRHSAYDFEAEGFLTPALEMANGIFEGNLTVQLGEEAAPLEGKYTVVDPRKADDKTVKGFNRYYEYLLRA